VVDMTVPDTENSRAEEWMVDYETSCEMVCRNALVFPMELAIRDPVMNQCRTKIKTRFKLLMRRAK
jgi:hypothetical protein